MALVLIESKLTGDSTAGYKVVAYTADDLERELGATEVKTKLDTRIEALTDPGKYRARLDKALKEATDASSAQFGTIYYKYLEAGLPREEAKTLAIAAAKNTYQASMRVIRMTFPETASSLYSIGAKAGSGATPFEAMPAADVLAKK